MGCYLTCYPSRIIDLGCNTCRESGPGASLWLMRVFGILLALWVISVMIMGLSLRVLEELVTNPSRSDPCMEAVNGNCTELFSISTAALHAFNDTSTGQNNQLYSPSEREFLTSKRRILDDSVLNFLSVRRTSCNSHVSFKIVRKNHDLA